MVKVDCSELRGEVKLALAIAISDRLAGSGLALLKGDSIVIDGISGPDVGVAQVRSTVESFLSKREDGFAYEVEEDGDSIFVRYLGPPPQDKEVTTTLPPGLFQCPTCGFITDSQGNYDAHVRLHDYVRGLAT